MKVGPLRQTEFEAKSDQSGAEQKGSEVVWAFHSGREHGALHSFRALVGLNAQETR